MSSEFWSKLLTFHKWVNRRLWRQELKSRPGTLYLTVPAEKKENFCTMKTQRKEGRTVTSSHLWAVRASVDLSAFNHCRKHIARHNKVLARIKMWRSPVWFSDTTVALKHWEGSQIFKGLGNLMGFWFWRWSQATLPDAHAENTLSWKDFDSVRWAWHCEQQEERQSW